MEGGGEYIVKCSFLTGVTLFYVYFCTYHVKLGGTVCPCSSY